MLAGTVTGCSGASSSTAPSAPQIASAPAFSPAGGTYTSGQTVTITCTTPGATIYYTTNGTTPTTASTQYAAPIVVSGSETIQAIAVAAGYTSSSVSPAAYTITPPAAAPVFTPAAGTYTSVQSVALSDTTPGATIFYTLNGSAPTAASTVYTAPIAVGTSETIQAVAVATGYTMSPTASAAYTINLPAAAPTFTPAAGTYASTQNVALADTTPGATIFYTVDGSIPSTSSTPYAAPVRVSSSETIQAIAVANGYAASPVASAGYIIPPPAALPTFSPAGGTYTSAQTVAISDATPGAAIYYTTNGDIPTTASALYTAPIAVSSSEVIQVIVVAPGRTNTAAFAAYTINLPAAVAPAFSPIGGSYTKVQLVTLASTTPGATVYYTTDGSTPTTSSAPYTVPIPVSTNLTLQAIAVAPGYNSSIVNAATYAVTLPAGTLSVFAGGGNLLAFSLAGTTKSVAATSATLLTPFGVTFDGSGNLYFTDGFYVGKVDTSGQLTVFAGGVQGYTGDGGPANLASLENVFGITVDATGNVFVADATSSVVRKIATSGIISTFAGHPTNPFMPLPACCGDGGPATGAELTLPYGVAADKSGNVYIADTQNQSIRKVTSSGTITLYAGTEAVRGGFSGDGGPAANALLSNPYDLAFDPAGNLYIADTSNNRIRKITPAGVISTIAGNGSVTGGDGGPATSAAVYTPLGIAVDPSGVIYFIDGNGLIRRITPGGMISTITGGAIQPVNTYYPGQFGLRVDGVGNLYFCDTGKSVVYKLTFAH